MRVVVTTLALIDREANHFKWYRVAYERGDSTTGLFSYGRIGATGPAPRTGPVNKKLGEKLAKGYEQVESVTLEADSLRSAFDTVARREPEVIFQNAEALRRAGVDPDTLMGGGVASAKDGDEGWLGELRQRAVRVIVLAGTDKEQAFIQYPNLRADLDATIAEVETLSSLLTTIEEALRA